MKAARIGFLVILVALSLRSFTAHAGSGPIIALFDMEDRGSKLDKDVLVNLVEYLGARLAEGGYQVVPRDQIRQRLLESKTESYKSCFDQSCQIELGRELAAQKTLATKILRIGDTCQVTSVMYDLKKATTEMAATAEADCEVNKLLVAVKKIAERLCAPLQKASKQADAKLAEYEKLAKDAESEKAERERAEKAWEMVMSIVSDEKVPLEKRLMALEKYQRDFKKPNPRLEEAEKLIAQLSLATLTVRTVPKDAKIAIAGESAGGSPVAKRLKPGVYDVVATKPGYTRAVTKAKLEPGQNVEVTLTLAPEIKASAQAETTPATTPEVSASAGKAQARPMHPMRLWGHITFWSGVGAAGLAGASAALAYKYGADAETTDKSKLWGGVFWASCAGAVALVGTGIVLWMLAPEEEPEGMITFGPSFNGEDLVFSLGGRW